MNRRNIQSSALLVNNTLKKGIRGPNDSCQTQCIPEENAGNNQSIVLPNQKDEIIKDTSTKNVSLLQYGPEETNRQKIKAMESEELKQQNTHPTECLIKEHSYAQNTLKKRVKKNNLNRKNAVGESIEQSESSRIPVTHDSEDLGITQQHEKQIIKNSPEACNVSQDHLTLNSSDKLFVNTSPVQQETNEGYVCLLSVICYVFIYLFVYVFIYFFLSSLVSLLLLMMAMKGYSSKAYRILC